MSEKLKEAGFSVHSTDLIDRGYGVGGVDFLSQTTPFNGHIVTNPPYKFAQEFVEHALSLVHPGNKVCMFLKLQFLESKSRRKLFDVTPPKTVYVCSGRVLCAKNGDFDAMRAGGGSAISYAWFVWEKGHQNDTILKWIN